ncbi:MAG: hypothetical protein ABII07_05820 [Patescibacteria group bacterium]|nr:hypothetical protein [Patescibacteria group bacterium]
MTQEEFPIKILTDSGHRRIDAYAPDSRLESTVMAVVLVAGLAVQVVLTNCRGCFSGADEETPALMEDDDGDF